MKYKEDPETLQFTIRGFDQGFCSCDELYCLDRNATFHLTWSNVKVKIMLSSSMILVKHYVKKGRCYNIIIQNNTVIVVQKVRKRNCSVILHTCPCLDAVNTKTYTGFTGPLTLIEQRT